MESKLQSKIIRWLKDQGAYVIKPKAGPGVPTGCPDVLFFFEERWGCIEVKASSYAAFQTGQQATLHHLRSGNPFVYIATPESWPSIKNEIIANFFNPLRLDDMLEA
jgi:hypothetical protein